jgi:superfamily I DNA/RNA helicase
MKKVVLLRQPFFEEKMRKPTKNGEFAILYRTNAQSRAMEDGKRDIPYRIYGGLSFIKVKKLKTFCVICVWLSIQRRRSMSNQLSGKRNW